MLEQCEDCRENLRVAYSGITRLFYVAKRGCYSRTKFTRELKDSFQYEVGTSRLKKISLEQTWKDVEWKKRNGTKEWGESYFKLDWDEYLQKHTFFVTIRNSEDKKWWIIFIIKEEINKRYLYKGFVRNLNQEIIKFDEINQLGRGASFSGNEYYY